MTWAEAKAKSGVGSSSSGKKKMPPKNVSHNQILAQKIISKQKNSGEPTISRKDLRKAARDDERAAAAIQAAKEERERERQSQRVRPSEQAKERMAELARKLDSQKSSNYWNQDNMEQMNQIAECRNMQLDEILALEAIFSDTKEFRISKGCDIEVLRDACDKYAEDPDDEGVLKSIAEHPDVSFSLQLTIDDTGGCQNEDMDLVASILLSVSFPSMYPLYDEIPSFKLADVMITDKNAENSPDKPLESLGFLDEQKLIEDLNQQARDILPDLCVYEIGVGWLTENAFSSLEMRTHATL